MTQPNTNSGLRPGWMLLQVEEAKKARDSLPQWMKDWDKIPRQPKDDYVPDVTSYGNY